MIPEPQQEQAVLYALGLLNADEAAGFEHLLDADPELQDFARDCQEASAALVLGLAPASDEPPSALKDRVMAHLVPTITVVSDAPMPTPVVASRPGQNKVVPFVTRVLPWAVAAGLLVFCSVLGTSHARLREENHGLLDRLAEMNRRHAPDLLAEVSFCQLEPVAAKAPAQPRAVVAWDSTRHEGVIQIVQLTAPAKDKDYQLWTVEEGRQDAINAGLVRVDGSGRAQTVFKPEAVDGGGRVLAFALSLEKEGGAPKNAGPIVLQGKL